MAEWIYFIHAPREGFAETMTDEERAVWGVHFERLQELSQSVHDSPTPRRAPRPAGPAACRRARHHRAPKLENRR